MKKFLLLSDDLRMSSGIAVSKELVFNTFEHYDWVQLGEKVSYEKGKEIDLGEDEN